MGGDLSRHLETAQKTGALNLSASELKKLPKDVLALTNLRTLDLSKNALKELPPPLGAMVGMKQFNAAHNALRSVPPALFDAWKSCEVVNLGGNRLAALPSLAGLARLKKLLVAGNSLTSLPESLGACSKLELIDASGNQLGEVPPQMGGLRLLNELLLASNQLMMLPPELAGCAKLVILDISGNGITGAAIPPGLLSGTNLARLWREGCPIDEAELSALPGYEAFKGREAHREAKKLDQRRAETGNITFSAGEERGIVGR